MTRPDGRLPLKSLQRGCRVALLAVGAGVVLLLTACAATTPTGVAPTAPATAGAPAPAGAASTIIPLPTDTKADYQLGGGYSPAARVGIVTRDSTDTPAKGLYSICYVNGFQTQGGDRQAWLTKYPTLVLRYANSKPVFDPGWPDEMLLDSSTAARRAGITGVIGKTIDHCKAAGFQAVEFDNLDSWTRSHHRLTKADNVALATLFVRRAHADGLAAGQKNTTELGAAGRTSIGFDFAVAEECYRYDECASYTRVYGRRVIDIEYTDDLRGTFAAACAAPGRPAMTILRDRDLTTPSSKKYVYRSC
jgi:hypothetical protein